VDARPLALDDVSGSLWGGGDAEGDEQSTSNHNTAAVAWKHQQQEEEEEEEGPNCFLDHEHVKKPSK
jgi:hypothetical protein